jgi:hypothetical protein
MQKVKKVIHLWRGGHLKSFSQVTNCGLWFKTISENSRPNVMTLETMVATKMDSDLLCKNCGKTKGRSL